MSNYFFAEKIYSISDSKFSDLLRKFELGTNRLTKISDILSITWNPSAKDPRIFHNHYIDLIFATFVIKIAQLSESIIIAINRSDYLSYALAGRSLIEHTAMLWYYIQIKYLPLFKKKNLNYSDLKKLIDIDDKYFRGSRFDWESFLFKNYKKMKENAIKKLKKHKVEIDFIQQVNAKTCIEHWGKLYPEVLIGYDLFCDLVHPNIGSNFLVSGIEENKLIFSRNIQNMNGFYIFKESFPILLTLTTQEMTKILPELLMLKWREDEIDA